MDPGSAPRGNKVCIPNLLSGFRLLAAPVMLLLAWIGRPTGFLALLAISLCSDALDGWLARRLKRQSALGARLDSWGDFATYVTVPLGAWWLWPGILRREAVYVGLAIGAYLLPAAIGFAKFGGLTSYHTLAAKAGAVIMSFGALLLFLADVAWPFRFAAVFQALEALEEIAITLTIPRRRSNIPSLWHAITQTAESSRGEDSDRSLDHKK